MTTPVENPDEPSTVAPVKFREVYAVVWQQKTPNPAVPADKQSGLITIFHSKKLAKKVVTIFNDSPFHAAFQHVVATMQVPLIPQPELDKLAAKDHVVSEVAEPDLVKEFAENQTQTEWSLENEKAEKDLGAFTYAEAGTVPNLAKADEVPRGE